MREGKRGSNLLSQKSIQGKGWVSELGSWEGKGKGKRKIGILGMGMGFWEREWML